MSLTSRSPHKKSQKREKQTRYLSQAIQLEESVNPHIIRATMGMVSLAILIFMIWAGFTNINEVARTPGEVVPKGFQQIVQHLEGGLVRSIDVHEGDVVEQGQLLMHLDGAGIETDLERALSKQTSLEMQAERLRAFVEDRTPDFTKFPDASESLKNDQLTFFDGMKAARMKEEKIIQEQVSQKKQSIQSLNSDLKTAEENFKITNEIYAKRAELNQKGYSSSMDLLESEKLVNDIEGDISRLSNQILVAQGEIVEFEDRLASLTARHRDEAYEKLDIVAGEIAQNKETIHKLQDRIERLTVKAPVRGLVKGLSVNTMGAVVQPGQTLMEIVPLDKELEVHVKISPKDIGHLKTGQPVQIKFSTFDFSRYGSVQGTLNHISATTFSGEGGERYYQGRVSLTQNYVGDNPANLIMPGMTVMADVITGEKTILQYLLKPIHMSLKTAFTER